MAVVEQREIRLHGHRVAYRTGAHPEADQPVLLFVHGLAGCSATWRAVLPALAERATVIAPDLPGHGRSDKPRQDYSLGAQAAMLRDLCGALGVERATVVGHSLGGGVAMQLAYQHPELCERLVLVASGGLGDEVSWLLRLLALPGAEYLLPVAFPGFVRDAGNGISRGLARLGFRAPRLEQEWRAYTSLADPESRQSFVRTLRAVIEPRGQAVSAADKLYLASELPTLIVWGAQDRIIPVEHARTAHEMVPGSRLVVLDHAGHFPHAEEPARFVEVVLDLLETTDGHRHDHAGRRARLAAGASGRQPIE